MKTSEQGIRALMKSEELRTEAYDDGVGVWTIGYGTTRINGVKVKKGDRITPERAESELRKFVVGLEAGITTALGKSPTKQNEFDAFVNIAYNIGLPSALDSTFLKRHIEGDKKGCAEAITWWNKGGGRTLKGLVNRRAREVQMYLNGIYVL